MKKTTITIIAAITAITAATAAPISAGAAAYTDVSESHWAYDTVENVTARNIFDGYEDGTFRPNNDITHEEFTKVIISLISGNLAAGESGTWTGWAQPYLNKAMELNVITAADNELLAVNTPITRKEMATIAVRAIESQGRTLNADTAACESGIADWTNIPEAYREYIAKAYTNGIINGYEDNTFRPDGCLTRAETAAVITRALEYIGIETAHKRIEDMTQEEKNEFAANYYKSHPDISVTPSQSGKTALFPDAYLIQIEQEKEDVELQTRLYYDDVNRYLERLQTVFGDTIYEGSEKRIEDMTQEEKNEFAANYYKSHPDISVTPSQSGKTALFPDAYLIQIEQEKEDVELQTRLYYDDVNRYLERLQTVFGDAIYED